MQCKKSVLLPLMLIIVMGAQNLSINPPDKEFITQTDSIEPETSLNTYGTALWSYSFGSNMYSTPIIGDVDNDGNNEVIVANMGDTIRCFHGNNNTIMWTLTIPGSINEGGLTLTDLNGDGNKEILFGTLGTNSLYCINASNKETIWIRPISGQIGTRPVVVDVDLDGNKDVLIGDTTSRIYSFDQNGIPIFSRIIGTPNYGDLMVADLEGNGDYEVLIPQDNGYLNCSSAYTLTYNWHYYCNGRVLFSPIACDVNQDGKKEVLVGSDANYIYMLHHNGTLFWQKSFSTDMRLSPVIADLENTGTITIFTFSGQNLYSIRGNSGGTNWITEFNASIACSPAIADINGDGILDLVVSCSGNLFLLNPWTGEIIDHSYTGFNFEEGIILGDVNGDDDLEIVGIDTASSIRCLDCAGSAWFLPTPWPFSGGSSWQNSFCQDSDGDHYLDTFETALGTKINDVDTDDDGFPEYWEMQYDLNPMQYTSPSGDIDSDLLTNQEEYTAGTHPKVYDTDNDLCGDGWEIQYGLNPLSGSDGALDFDSDTLVNWEEQVYNTNPNKADTDDDLCTDDWEVLYGFDPTTDDASNDFDNDGLTNVEEFNLKTHPKELDTDGDFLGDGWEVTYGLDPLAQDDLLSDVDDDGLTLLQEYLANTNPNDADSDGDFVPDGLDTWPNSWYMPWAVVIGTLGLIFISRRRPPKSKLDADEAKTEPSKDKELNTTKRKETLSDQQKPVPKKASEPAKKPTTTLAKKEEPPAKKT